MSGKTLDFKKNLSLQVSQYYQVHEEENPCNSQIACTKGMISLGPSGNLQGGYHFMALDSSKKINQCTWDIIPMLDLVIAWVKKLGSDQRKLLMFTDRHGYPIGNIEVADDIASDEDNDALLPGVDPVLDNIKITGVDDVPPEAPPPTVEFEDLNFPESDPAPIETETAPAPATEAPGLCCSMRVHTEIKQYTLSMTGTKYSYAFTQLESHGMLNPDAHMFVQEDFYQAEPDIMAAIMMQLLLKFGLREWGNRAHKAAASEMKQLHIWNRSIGVT